MKQAQARQDLNIVGHRFAEPDARIDDQALAWNTGPYAGFDTRLELVVDVEQHVLIARILLHGARIAERMHEHDR